MPKLALNCDTINNLKKAIGKLAALDPTSIAQDRDEAINNIIEFIEEKSKLNLTDNELNSLIFNKNVIVIGKTKAGKSSLINVLLENARIESERIVVKDQSKGPVIGMKLASETADVTSWINLNDKINYWDFPGIIDNRGSAQNIVNKFLYDYVLNKINVSLLFVMESSNIAEAERIQELVGKVKKFFGSIELVEKLAEAKVISFCITKGQYDEIESYQKSFNEILKEYKSPGNEKIENYKCIIDLLTLLSTTMPLCALREPRAAVDFESKLPTYKKCITAVLNTLKPYECSNTSINVSLPSSITLQVLAASKGLNKYATELIEQIGNYYKNILSQSLTDQAGNIQELRKQLNTESRVLEFSAQENIDGFIKRLKSSKRQEITSKVEVIEKINKCFKEFKSFDSTSEEPNLDKWKVKLGEIKQTYSKFGSNISEKIKVIDNILILTVPIISVSEIQNQINAKIKAGEITGIRLHAYLFLLDQDLTAPSTDLSITALKWIVIGAKKISLKGQHGNHSNNPESIHGSKGGNLYCYAKEVIKIPIKHIIPQEDASITIDTTGGNGINGQDGKFTIKHLADKIEIAKLRLQQTKFEVNKQEQLLELALKDINIYTQFIQNTEQEIQELENKFQQHAKAQYGRCDDEEKLRMLKQKLEKTKDIQNSIDHYKQLKILADDFDNLQTQLIMKESALNELIKTKSKSHNEIELNLNSEQLKKLQQDINSFNLSDQIKFDINSADIKSLQSEINNLETELKDCKFETRRDITLYLNNPENTAGEICVRHNWNSKDLYKFLQYDFKREENLLKLELDKLIRGGKTTETYLEQFNKDHSLYNNAKREFDEARTNFNSLYQEIKNEVSKVKTQDTEFYTALLERLENLNMSKQRLTMDEENLIQELAKKDNSLLTSVRHEIRNNKAGGRLMNYYDQNPEKLISDYKKHINEFSARLEFERIKAENFSLERFKISAQLKELRSQLEIQRRLVEEYLINQDILLFVTVLSIDGQSTELSITDNDLLLSMIKLNNSSQLKTFISLKQEEEKLSCSSDDLSRTQKYLNDIIYSYVNRLNYKSTHLVKLENRYKILSTTKEVFNTQETQFLKFTNESSKNYREVENIIEYNTKASNAYQEIRNTEKKMLALQKQELQTAKELLKSHEEIVLERKEYKPDENSKYEQWMFFLKELVVFNKQYVQYHHIEGQKGTLGGNAGAGGQYDISNLSGQVKVVITGSFKELFANEKIEKIGLAKHGNIGKGGEHPKAIEGVYFNEVSFHFIRSCLAVLMQRFDLGQKIKHIVNLLHIIGINGKNFEDILKNSIDFEPVQEKNVLREDGGGSGVALLTAAAGGKIINSIKVVSPVFSSTSLAEKLFGTQGLPPYLIKFINSLGAELEWTYLPQILKCLQGDFTNAFAIREGIEKIIGPFPTIGFFFSMILQAIASPITAYVSSDWIDGPYQTISVESKADDGKPCNTIAEYVIPKKEIILNYSEYLGSIFSEVCCISQKDAALINSEFNTHTISCTGDNYILE